jgi:hypothetical protein
MTAAGHSDPPVAHGAPDAGVPIVLLDPFNGGLSAVRALRRGGQRVVVVAAPVYGHVARARGVEGHVVGFHPAGERWLEILTALARRGPHIALTGGDTASAWLATMRDRLPPELLTFESQDDAHLKLMSKDSADAFARVAGVDVPWTMPVRSHSDLDDALSEAPWPAFSSQSSPTPGGRSSATIAWRWFTMRRKPAATPSARSWPTSRCCSASTSPATMGT